MADAETIKQFVVSLGYTVDDASQQRAQRGMQATEQSTAALRQALASVLAEPGYALADACQKVAQMLREHGEDDITLMLARIR